MPGDPRAAGWGRRRGPGRGHPARRRRRQRPRLPAASGRWAASWKPGGGGARGCVSGCRAQPPRLLRGIRKSHGPPRARQPRTLGPGTFSLALVASQTQERLSDPRRGLPRSARWPQSPRLPLGYLHALPLLHRLQNGSPRGMPRELGTVLGSLPFWNFIAAGWVTLLHPWQGWGGRSPSAPPVQRVGRCSAG